MWTIEHILYFAVALNIFSAISLCYELYGKHIREQYIARLKYENRKLRREVRNAKRT